MKIVGVSPNKYEPTVTDNKILGFFKEYRWMSNFHMCKVYVDSITYPSTEHAYQALKTLDHEQRVAISKLATAAEAKRAGQRVTKREDWEIYKPVAMMQVCMAKFIQNPDLGHMLQRTNGYYLEETNDWGDTYWGVVPGRGGMNMLGKVLMAVREQLISNGVYPIQK